MNDQSLINASAAPNVINGITNAVNIINGLYRSASFIPAVTLAVKLNAATTPDKTVSNIPRPVATGITAVGFGKKDIAAKRAPNMNMTATSGNNTLLRCAILLTPMSLDLLKMFKEVVNAISTTPRPIAIGTIASGCGKYDIAAKTAPMAAITPTNIQSVAIVLPNDFLPVCMNCNVLINSANIPSIELMAVTALARSFSSRSASAITEPINNNIVVFIATIVA